MIRTNVNVQLFQTFKNIYHLFPELGVVNIKFKIFIPYVDS